MKNKMTILVCSCDSYSDLWDPFFTLLKKYWKDCPYEIVLNTETKSYSFDGLNIKCYQPYKDVPAKKLKKIPYGTRMLDTLSHIDTEYLLLMMDDFFIEATVNEKRIDEVISLMDNDSNIAAITMYYSFDNFDEVLEEYKGFRLRHNYSDFKYNMQAGIWRTSVFKDSWKKYDSPWGWEAFGNIRSINDGYKYFGIDYKGEPLVNYLDPSDSGYLGVTSGKWTWYAKKVLDKNGIDVDYSKRGMINSGESKYSEVSAIRRLFRAFDFKKIKYLRKTAGLKWCVRYIKWRIRALVTGDTRDFIEIYRLKHPKRIK